MPTTALVLLLSTVEKFATEYNWEYGEKIVRTFPERQGLKKHILQCGDYTSKYDVVVILEDGAKDSFAAKTARKILEAYYNIDTNDNSEKENTKASSYAETQR